MTVREAQERVSMDELRWWMAYDRAHPIGPERIEAHLAQVSAVVAQGNAKKGKKFSIKDFMIQWGRQKVKVTPLSEIAEIMKSLGAKVTKRKVR